MAQRILRAMEYGDILDEMFDLYKNHFLLFVGIAAVVHLPISLIGGLLTDSTLRSVFGILTLPLYFVVTAASTLAVSQAYLGHTTTIAESYKTVGGKIIGLIAAMILASLVVFGGFLLLIVPGIIFMFWYTFISQVVVIEGESGWEACKRSRELAGGQWLRIFVLGLLTSLIVWIGSAILVGPITFLAAMGKSSGASPAGPLAVILGVVQGISQSLLTPIQTIAFVLLYYDIRVRKEGFDLELLAANISGVETPPPPEPPAVTTI